MNKFRIAPSILSADLARLGEEVDRVTQAGADIIHFDVMDNHYVPNLTFGPMICSALRDYGVSLPLDVHLMVEPVDQLITDFAKAGASTISFHPEASKHVDRSVRLVKELGCSAGLVLNPATPIGLLEHVIEEIDFILMMTVNPGFGGQKFIPSSLDKIRKVREFIVSSGRDVKIQIDGGVKIDNIAEIAAAGADTFVAGSAIFGASDYAKVIDAMRTELASVGE